VPSRSWSLLRKLGELREDEMPREHRDPEKVEQLRKRFKDKSGWMQVPMKKVIDDVRPLWRTPDGKGEANFAQMVETLHLTGDRHSHVGAGDTLRFLAGDRIALGPTDHAPAWGHQAMIMGGWSLLNTTDLAIKVALQDLVWVEAEEAPQRGLPQPDSLPPLPSRSSARSSS